MRDNEVGPWIDSQWHQLTKADTRAMIYHSRAAYRNKITAKTDGLSRGAAPGDSHFMGQTAGVGDGIRLFAEEDQGLEEAR